MLDGEDRRCPLDAARYRMRIHARDGRMETVAAACENGSMNFQLMAAVLG